MKNQHDQVISELKDGKFLHLLSLDTQVIDERGLNEMVIDYLNENDFEGDKSDKSS